jgi:hypothetical protein
VVKFDQLIGLPKGQVAVEFSNECATAARQQLRGRLGVLNRMAQDKHARAARQRRKLSQRSGMIAHLRVAQFVVAQEIGRGRVNDYQINLAAAFGSAFGEHGVDAECAGYKADGVRGAVAARRGIVGNNPHAQIVRIFASKIDHHAVVDRMTAELPIFARSVGNQPGNQ